MFRDNLNERLFRWNDQCTDRHLFFRRQSQIKWFSFIFYLDGENNRFLMGKHATRTKQTSIRLQWTFLGYLKSMVLIPRAHHSIRTFFHGNIGNSNEKNRNVDHSKWTRRYRKKFLRKSQWSVSSSRWALCAFSQPNRVIKKSTPKPKWLLKKTLIIRSTAMEIYIKYFDR